jgi:hypothetical protein
LAFVFTFLNPFFFIYAFEGRMYSIMALGAAASMYFYLAIITREKKKKKYSLPKKLIVGYALATAWALYSHHFAIFAVFVQGIGFLIEVGRRRWHTVYALVIGFALAGIFYIPWIIPLYNQTKMVTGGFWLGTPTTDDLKKLIYEYLAKGTYHRLSQTALYLVFASLLVRRWHITIHKTLLLAMWFLVPIVATWLVSQKIQSIFYNRYLLYAIPGAMLVLVSNRRAISNILLGILIIVFAIIDFHYFTHPIKRPFQELAAYVIENKRGDDYLVNWNSTSHHLWETKYYQIPAPIYLPQGSGNLPFFVGTALMEQQDIVSTIPPKKYYRVGVITSGPIDEVVIPGYTEEDYKVFGDLKMLWLRRL